MNEEILVPIDWLERLLSYTERVTKQIEELPENERSIIYKTDISMLIGFASSSKVIIKYKL